GPSGYDRNRSQSLHSHSIGRLKPASEVRSQPAAAIHPRDLVLAAELAPRAHPVREAAPTYRPDLRRPHRRAADAVRAVILVDVAEGRVQFLREVIQVWEHVDKLDQVTMPAGRADALGEDGPDVEIADGRVAALRRQCDRPLHLLADQVLPES